MSTFRVVVVVVGLALLLCGCQPGEPASVVAGQHGQPLVQERHCFAAASQGSEGRQGGEGRVHAAAMALACSLHTVAMRLAHGGHGT